MGHLRASTAPMQAAHNTPTHLRMAPAATACEWREAHVTSLQPPLHLLLSAHLAPRRQRDVVAHSRVALAHKNVGILQPGMFTAGRGSVPVVAWFCVRWVLHGIMGRKPAHLVQRDGLPRLDALPLRHRPRAAQQVEQLVVPVMLLVPALGWPENGPAQVRGVLGEEQYGFQCADLNTMPCCTHAMACIPPQRSSCWHGQGSPRAAVLRRVAALVGHEPDLQEAARLVSIVHLGMHHTCGKTKQRRASGLLRVWEAGELTSVKAGLDRAPPMPAVPPPSLPPCPAAAAPQTAARCTSHSSTHLCLPTCTARSRGAVTHNFPCCRGGSAPPAR